MIAMRAMVATGYGGPEVLELTDLAPGEVGPGEVRVQVRAASVNPVDIAIREGYLQSYFSPVFPLVLGLDVAGVVDEVGSDVTEFAAGDEVIGYLLGEGLSRGAFAEMVTASASSANPQRWTSSPPRQCRTRV